MSDKTDYGKGSRYRPVDRKKWDKNWPRIFKDGRCWYYSRTKKKWVSIKQEKSNG